MIDDLVPLGITQPGFFGNGTEYQAKGRWRRGNFIRFHEGTIQPIGGWVQRDLTGATIIGTPQASLCWNSQNGAPFVAVGTTRGLYVIDENDVVYDITPDPATILPPEFNWQLSNFGAYLMATNSLIGDQDLTLVNVYKWIGDTAAKALPAWTSSIGPRGAYACFATPERHFIVLRGQDPTTHTARSGVDTLYSERRYYFSSTEELDEFVSTDTNTGGDYDLETPGRLITGTKGKDGESFIWTDVDFWKITFVGGDFIYTNKKAGDDCGILSKNAFVQIDKGTYWMARGKFFVYDGYTHSIPCEVTDAVFGDFNEQRAHTVWAYSNARFNELTWFYPSGGSQFPDRYVTYNHVEGHWVNGKLDRAAGVPKRFNNDVIDETKPAFFNADGDLFQHETGNERDSLAFLESGPTELGNGDRLMRLQGIMEDTKASGDVQLRVFTSFAADDLETLHGPYALGPVTNLRLKARQVRLRLEEAARASWRVGNPRLAVRAVERRGIGPGSVDDVPASLEIIPSSITLIDSQHYTFQSIVRNAAGQVLDILPDTWTSDNAAQVPVDGNGTVTALATPAVAHIQAFITSPALSSNIATVTVQGSTVPVSIEITPITADISASSTQVMTAVVRNNHGQIIVGQQIDSWTSTSPSKATVAGNGGLNLTATVTGVALGATQINAHITSPVSIDSNNAVINVLDPFVTHTFLSSGQFHVTSIGTGLVRVLAVGGGASAADVCGTGVGAGGGGGGKVIDTLTENVPISLGDNPANVGDGGAAALAVWIPGLTVADGNPGAHSTFSTVDAPGGGKGSASGPGGSVSDGGGAAGNGGGGRGAGDGSFTAGGSGTQHNGGSGGSGVGGGGGGAGADGFPGMAGLSIVVTILGIAQNYGAGGDPGTSISYAGGDRDPIAGSPGAANTGNGGSSGVPGYKTLPGSGLFEGDVEGLSLGSGAGGKGIIIIRYPVSSGIVATGGIKIVH